MAEEKPKNITIDDLAIMVQKGFSATDEKIENGFKEVNARFKEVNARLDNIENFMLKQHSLQIESLELRLKRLEDALTIK